MAFKKKERVAGKKSYDMTVGESIVGYAMGTKTTTYEGKDTVNLILQDPETKQNFVLFSSGTLKYAAADGLVEMGFLTKITRLKDEKKVTKSGQKYNLAVFEVEQDEEDFIEPLAQGSEVQVTTTEEEAAEKRSEQISKLKRA